MSFADNSFSLIICTGVVSLIPDLWAPYREMLRVLEPGGIMLLTGADYRFPNELH
ncbi:MAG TPA: methyltransferase domain-containing protein [Bacteroidota bacterium]|nr:methyltransferase domain-containing protein [Bacteroidota bacterium]